jgi:hypothetical protein
MEEIRHVRQAGAEIQIVEEFQPCSWIMAEVEFRRPYNSRFCLGLGMPLLADGPATGLGAPACRGTPSAPCHEFAGYLGQDDLLPVFQHLQEL